MKVALVTGAARRIGAEICRHLHDHGWRLVVHSNHSRGEADKLVQELNDIRSGSAVAVTADLASSKAITSLASRGVSAFGRLDLLVNNASLFFSTSDSSKEDDEFDRMVAVNARAPYLLIRALEKDLTGGSVVNITDIHGETPLKGFAVYSASKAALGMLTRSLAIDLAPDVRVNSVAPGAILWPENEAEMKDQEKIALLDNIPLGKIGDPLDIAKAVRFLAEDALFVTGQTIRIDGGQSA